MFTYIINRVLNLKSTIENDLLILDHNLNNFFYNFLPKEYNLNQFKKGKRIRSILYYHFFNSSISADSKKKHKIIMLIEALHLASLIHDDVVDQNMLRRNSESFFNKFGTKLSILFGDYLLSKIYPNLKALKYDNFIETQFFKACSETAYGAFLEQSMNETSTIETYLKIAYLKTSSIFKLSCLLGSYISESAFSNVKTAATFGTCFGILFQAQNDLDCYRYSNFQDSEDYMQKNITLPMIILAKYMNFAIDYFYESNQENYIKIQTAINSSTFKEIALQKLNKYIQISETILESMTTF